MSLLDKMIQKSISKGVGRTIGKSAQDAAGKVVEQIVKPTTEKLAEQVANAASRKIQETASSFREAGAAMSEAQEEAKGVTKEQWGQAFSFLEGMANDMIKDVRVCPACEEPVKGNVQFCPKCGVRLPEMTVMELAVCSKCGNQNAPATDFCTACGAKLPGKELQEEAQRTKDAAMLSAWTEKLPQFPVWDCGGSHFDLAELEQGRIYFSAWFDGNAPAAEKAVKQYVLRLIENGFQKAGQYPSEEHLYKMADGVCLHADTEHCFEGDSDTPSVYFHIGDEPSGGFYYVKPEPEKSDRLFGGLFR